VDYLPFLGELLSHWPKLIGVEMESGGVASAAFQAAKAASFFMIRGVSDLAENKDDTWRQYACHTAAAYVLALLQSGPVQLTMPVASKTIKPPELADIKAELIVEETTMLADDLPEAQIRHAQDAFKNHPLLHQFLKWKYQGEPILERCGEVYPVAVYPASKSQSRFPDSVLLSLDERRTPDQDNLVQDSTLRQLVAQIGRAMLQNRATFTMKELVIDRDQSGSMTQVGLKCGLGTYFKALDTCDSLEWEILSKITNLSDSSNKAFEQFDSQLALRSALHTKVANPVRYGSCRSAAIAISTLVAYNDAGTYNLWVKLRSANAVAVHANLIHVIPSFMFQPATDYLKEEFSVKHNIYREYLEEVFNEPEPQEGEAGHWRYFYDDPRLRYLRRLLYAQKAELYFSGVAVNLLNLRPEICTVLLIRSSAWCNSQKFHFNLEWASALNQENNQENVIARVPYKARDEELMQEAPLHANKMVSPGAAAFWLGIDVLRNVLNESPQNARVRSIPSMVFRNPGVMAFSEGVGNI
jgi:hypothetical protein